MTSDGTEQAVAYSVLSACIDEQKRWVTANGLKFNDGKADALLVSSSSRMIQPDRKSLLPVGGILDTPSGSVKNLGVILDPHLTMEL